MEKQFEWPPLKIEKQAVIELLKWPWLFNVSAWPPHQYSWSSLDERAIVLWVATAFTSHKDMSKWLAKHCKGKVENIHQEYIDWLNPDKTSTLPQSNDEFSDDVIPFILDCLDRSLLWYDPSPIWPSDLKGAVYFSRRLFIQWKNTGYLSFDEKTSAMHYLDKELGWDQWQSLPNTRVIHSILKLLSFMSQLGDCQTIRIEDLLFEAKEALFCSIESLWRSKTNGDWEDFDEAIGEYLSANYLSHRNVYHRLIQSETHWYQHNLCHSLIQNL